MEILAHNIASSYCIALKAFLQCNKHYRQRRVTEELKVTKGGGENHFPLNRAISIAEAYCNIKYEILGVFFSA
jgi:hypothetical protein